MGILAYRWGPGHLAELEIHALLILLVAERILKYIDVKVALDLSGDFYHILGGLLS
jgi:hypothetical protein